MAQRRMFSKKITDTDKFLEMPLSTQALYFHLNMGADDDGFVDRPKTIQRIVGASDDDLKLLLAKNFIISSDTGIVVIKDWRIHNYIRKDTYQPTIYQAEKLALESQMAQLPKPSTSRPRKVDAGKDRIGKDRIGKDRIGKDREDKDNISDPPDVNILKLFQDEFQRMLSGFEIEEINHLIAENNQDLVIEALKLAIQNGKPNIKYISGILRNWENANVTTVEQARNISKTSKKQRQKKETEEEWGF